MATPAELKDREDRLKADEVNWKSKKKQLERAIVKDNLTLDELASRLERTTELLGEKKTELEVVSTQSRALDSDLALKEQQVEHINGKVATAQSILTDLEAVIDHKRETIDSNLQEYSTKRKVEFRKQEQDDQNRATRARESADSLQVEVSAKRDELDALRQEVAILRQDHMLEVEGHRRIILALEQQQTPLESDIAALQAEVVKLARTRELIAADNKKSKEQNAAFIEYERRARKVLDTKDRELQDKAQELAIEDRHIKARGSYLTGL